PVSRNVQPKRSASSRATVLLPDATGPSIAIWSGMLHRSRGGLEGSCRRIGRHAEGAGDIFLWCMRLRIAEMAWAMSGLRCVELDERSAEADRKSTRLNSSHLVISYAVFCLKKKKKTEK